MQTASNSWRVQPACSSRTESWWSWPTWKPGYLVQAWRVFNPPNERSATWISPNLIELPSLDPVVTDEREVFQRIGMLLQATGLCPDTQVELCLPKKLLCCSLEDLKIKKLGGRNSTVARYYPVVVRLWERHFDPVFVSDPDYKRYKADWKAAWDKFRAEGHRQTNRITPDFFEGDDTEWVDIQLKELNGHGLVLTCCPHKPVGDNTVLDYLIDAAVPVAILPTKEDEAIVELGDPTSWPTSVLKCRQKQGGPALTLLWDDPDSVPAGLSTRPRMTSPPMRVP